MLINSVYLKNIKSYEEEKIDFRAGVNAISGENGAGKTTILEAIGYTVFDYLPFSQEKFIRRGSGEGKVVVELSCNGSSFKITRKCSSSDHYITSGDGEREIVSGVSDVKKWVANHIVSVNEEDLNKVFSNAIGVPQGRFTSSFLESRASRQKIFEPILGVDEYREAFDELRDPKKRVQEREQNLKNVILELKGKVSDLDEKKIKKEEVVEEIENKKRVFSRDKEELKELKEKKSSLKEVKEKIRELRTGINGVKSKLEGLISQKNDLSKEKKKAKKAKDIIENVEEEKREFEEIKSKLEALRDEKEDLLEKKEVKNSIEKKLVKLNEKKKSIKEFLEDIKELESDLEKIKEHKKRYESLRKKKERLNTEIQGLRDKKSDLLGKKEDSDLEKGVCPIFDDVKCESVEDLGNYFSEKIGNLEKKIEKKQSEKRECKEELNKFDFDPTEKLAVIKEKIAKKDKKEEELVKLNNEIKKEKSELKEIKKDISDLSKINKDIKGLKSNKNELKDAAKKYDRKKELASSFEKKKEKLEKTLDNISELKEKKQNLEEKLEEQKNSFSQTKFDEIKEKTKRLRDKVVSTKRDISNLKERLSELNKDINKLKSLKKKKENKEEDLRDIRNLREFFEFTRATLKEAAPHIAEAFIKNISKVADDYFKKITDNYKQSLSWSKDYEVIVKESGREKAFNQLSGGEKMAAAISVRLALLKTISESNIVFLDEPTENMDEVRREKLARQIKEIEGFNQIFVISHDETFNSVIENVTEIEKINGVSRVKEVGV